MRNAFDLTLGALAVLFPPSLEPVFNKKTASYSPVKSTLMRLPHPKIAGQYVAAKLQRFSEAFRQAVKDVGIECNTKELSTNPHATATLAQLHETFLLALAELCNPGEPFPPDMDPAARIDTLPGIPNIKVERENIQGWLKKIRSTKLNPKGKPLMIFRLTDIYKPFVTGETGLRLALIPNAAAAALLA